MYIKFIGSTKLKRIVLLGVFIGFLSACGGGGGSGNPDDGGGATGETVNILFKDCAKNNPYYDTTEATTKAYITASYTRRTFSPKFPAQFKCTDSAYGSDGKDVYFRSDRVKDADYLSFELINKFYAKDKDFIFFGKSRLRLTDKSTFEFLEPGSFYSRDKDNFFYKERPFVPADPATFTSMGRHIAIDSQHLYHKGSRHDQLNGFDKSTFSHIGGGYYAVGTSVYYLPDDETAIAIFGAAVIRVSNANPATATFIGGESLIDGTRIFENGTRTATNVVVSQGITDLGDRYLSIGDNLYFKGSLLAGASPQTYRPLGYGYTLDGLSLYREEVLIEQVDPALVNIRDGGYYLGSSGLYNPFGLQALNLATVEYLGLGFFKDDTAVFDFNRQVAGVDAATYEYLGFFGGARITRDATNVYVEKSVASNYDVGTFQILSPRYASNQGNVICALNNRSGIPITGADPATFEELAGNYAKDQNKVYHNCRALDLPDPATFVTLNDAYAKDSNRVYYNGIELPTADVNTFELIDDEYAKDSVAVYFRNSELLNADVNSIEVLIKYYIRESDNLPTVYAKDDTGYYMGRTPISAFNYDKNSVGIIGDSLFADANTIRLNGIDTQMVDFGYKSANYLVNNGEVLYMAPGQVYSPIANADAATFIRIRPGFAKDTLAVYKGGAIVPNLTPLQTKENVGHIYDNDTLIYISTMQEVAGVDLTSLQFFSVRWDTYYKDATTVYWKDQVVVDADVNTFDWRNFREGFDALWNYVDGVRTTPR